MCKYSILSSRKISRNNDDTEREMLNNVEAKPFMMIDVMVDDV